MGLGADLLRQAGILLPDTTATTTVTARGPVRLKKDGTPDRRSLLRGIAKPSRNKGVITSFEKKQLLKMLEGSTVGDEFEWKWRSRHTRKDPKLRAAQVNYAHCTAREFGYKIKTAGFTTGLRLTVIQIAD